MKKIVLAMVLGAVLGALDGLTAWFTPAVRDQVGAALAHDVANFG